MAGFKKGDQVTVDAPGLWGHGKTGQVTYVQSDGSLLLDIHSSFLDALLGTPAYRPDQVKPASD